LLLARALAYFGVLPVWERVTLDMLRSSQANGSWRGCQRDVLYWDNTRPSSEQWGGGVDTWYRARFSLVTKVPRVANMQFVGMLSSEQAPSLTPNLMSVPAKQLFTSLLA
jgi:hypothetical protein